MKNNSLIVIISCVPHYLHITGNLSPFLERRGYWYLSCDADTSSDDS